MRISSKFFRYLTLSIMLLTVCATASTQAEDAGKSQTSDSMMNMMDPNMYMNMMNPAMYMNMMGPMMNPAMYMNMMGPMMGMMNPMMGMMNPMMGMMNPMMGMMNPAAMTGGYNTNSMGQMMDPKQYENWFNQWNEMMKGSTAQQKQ